MKSEEESSSIKPWIHISILALAALFFVVPPLLRWWNLPPAVSMENLDCVRLLRTAVSSQNVQHLAGVRRLISKRSADGKMSSQEQSHFDSILKLAESSHWEDADEACIHFEMAQLNRRR